MAPSPDEHPIWVFESSLSDIFANRQSFKAGRLIYQELGN